MQMRRWRIPALNHTGAGSSPVSWLRDSFTQDDPLDVILHGRQVVLVDQLVDLLPQTADNLVLGVRTFHGGL